MPTVRIKGFLQCLNNHDTEVDVYMNVSETGEVGYGNVSPWTCPECTMIAIGKAIRS